MSKPVLHIKSLYKAFGEKVVLDGVDMQLEPQKVHSLIGPNGSGKTTLFNIVTGFVKPDGGTIYLNGKNVTKKAPAMINKWGISRTFQDLRLIHQLTVRENILLAMKHNPGEKFRNALLPRYFYRDFLREAEERLQEILKMVYLQEVAGQIADEISFGQQKLLTLGCCIANEPDVLLLDEPVAGINPAYREKMHELIDKLKEEGTTLLLVDHNPDFLEAVSDEVFFLNEGKLMQFPDYQAMKNEQYVQEAYL